MNGNKAQLQHNRDRACLQRNRKQTPWLATVGTNDGNGDVETRIKPSNHDRSDSNGDNEQKGIGGKHRTRNDAVMYCTYELMVNEAGRQDWSFSATRRLTLPATGVSHLTITGTQTCPPRLPGCRQQLAVHALFE